LSKEDVASIEQGQRKFQRYADATSICGLGSGGMQDPSVLTARLAEQMVDELLLDVANELASSLDAMVDTMAAAELQIE
jgi:hypothetical protein